MVCGPWVKILKERTAIPECFYKKNFLKNQQKEPEPVPENSENNDVLNETDTDWTQRNMPSGQGTPIRDEHKDESKPDSESETGCEDEDSFITITSKKQEKQ